MKDVPAEIGLATRPLDRIDLNEQVYNAVRALLLTGRLAPGQRLSLNQIADELSVSRSPVHHALTRLVGEGLVNKQIALPAVTRTAVKEPATQLIAKDDSHKATPSFKAALAAIRAAW